MNSGKLHQSNMDHNLDDPLTLESAMGVDFEHPVDTVVSEDGITLEQTVHEESIPMEFEHSEGQPILMDTTSEEMIDFMGDQFTLQEYSVQSDQTTGLTTTVESNEQNYLSAQSDTIIDLQFTAPVVSAIKPAEAIPPKLIAIKAIQPRQVIKKPEAVLSTAPKQVAIAPKPPKLVPKSHPLPKQLAIAPKPIALVATRGKSLVKKVSIANVVSSNSKGKTVLTKIGKQLIMVPSGSQKIKLVTPTAAPTVQYIRADSDKAQLIPTKNISGAQPKPLMTKLYTVQGRPNMDPLNQPAVITKIVPVEKPPRFVAMPQKNMPIAFGNKVLMATPSKQGLKLAKKQDIITIKSPTPKLLPASLVPHSSGPGKQKVVVTSSNAQNVILKTTAPPKPVHLTKDGSVVVGRQKSQLHQVNVPGKGIQYVRIFSSTPVPKPVPKPLLAVSPTTKTYVLTDDKGNPIQMKAEKLTTGEPLSLVVAGGAPSFKATCKTQKAIKLAPVTAKTAQPQTIANPGRSSQSLLAPLSPVQISDSNALVEVKSLSEVIPEQSEEEAEGGVEEEEADSKATLKALIENTISEDPNLDISEVEIDYKQHYSPQNSSIDSMEQHDSSGRSDEHPFIVLPAKYDSEHPEDQNRLDDSQRTDDLLNMDDEGNDNVYQSPTNGACGAEIVSTDLGLRPRKACNCTKSQCLKLYCDCFANGEFCNRCNCCNCHNNLENEELRQKAIRGCLERNPNAFRPKIGKSKTGGPEIIRRHNKGCNCKRSGCLKNYCECYEAKIACTAICKCVGCRNVEDTLERGRHRNMPRLLPAPSPVAASSQPKQPCSFMTAEVIEAVCQCLVAAAADGKEEQQQHADPMRDVIEEFARCLQDIISAAHHAAPPGSLDEVGLQELA